MRVIGPCLSAALALSTAFGQRGASTEDFRLDPRVLGSVARVDDRFQSYNVEMAEVIGARFWKPYDRMSATNAPPTDIQVGRDPNLFEARPPADLSDRRLRALAAALGPAYVRVSGTWANSVHFQNDDASAQTTPPEGFTGVLTRAQWRGVVDFAKAVDAKLVTSFAISAGVRDRSGAWTPVEARPWLDYTHAIGGEIFAAELFNEPNLSSYGGGPSGYNAAAFARDSAIFRTFLKEAAPNVRIAGPGDVVTANAAIPIPGASTAEDLLSAEPRPTFDLFSYHFYGGVSQRCAPPTTAGVGTSRDQALTDAWFTRTDLAFDAHKSLRDRFVPGAPIWLTETAQAACGGSPWAATFVDSFRYLDQMARLARRGVSAIFHNTLAASEYGLIEQTKLEPRPNYWAALLWRRLMGSVVLDAGPIGSGLHVYAHCLRDRPGGVTVLAINTSDAARALDVSTPADIYVLTASSLESTTVLLNGRPLAVGRDNRVPTFQPRRVQGPRVTVAPASIAFITTPQASNPSCR